MAAIDIETPHGPGRAHLHPASDARAALVLGHGAGGTVEAPDLLVATEAANAQQVSVALVEQPYLVAGKRSSPAPSTLDAAWLAAVAHLASGELSGMPLIVGGRSAGARVACRTAAQSGAAAVLCLAFPLQPPARKGKPPSPDRLHELDAVNVPTLVVQGESDRFGMPPEGEQREVARVPGDHALKKDLEAVGAAVAEWLAQLLR